MAIAFGATLGSTAPSGSSSSPVTFNTTATVPAGGLVVAVVQWYNNVTCTVTGGGLTWTSDKTQSGVSDTNLRILIASAPAPAGLASATTLTATFSGSSDVRAFAALYLTGADVVDVSGGAASSTNNTAWSVGFTTTNAADLAVGAAWMDALTTNITPAGTATEIFEVAHPDTPRLHVVYEVYSGTGAKTLGGSWTGTKMWVAAAVAYKATAGATNATVTAVVAAATGAAPSTTATASAHVTVTAVPAAATGDTPAAVVAGSGNATVTAVVALALGSAPPANSILSSVVNAPAVISLGSAPAAVLASAGNATVTAVPATALGSGPVAVVRAGSGVTAVAATALGSAPVAVVTAGQNVIAVPAFATGAALRPAITPAPTGGGVNGDVAATFAEAFS